MGFLFFGPLLPWAKLMLYNFEDLKNSVTSRLSSIGEPQMFLHLAERLR